MKSNILKIKVNITSYKKVVKQILNWIDADNAGKYICVSNVHMCMEAFDNPDFCKIVNEADLVVPDGRPLVWAQILLGQKNASQVRGSDLLLTVCKEAEKAGIPIGLYGGTEKTLAAFIAFLKTRYTNLKIPFASSPPFRELTQKEEDNYIHKLNTSGASVLFVGIGCPKQEKWMAKHKDRLNCVMIGVGAAFDFFSGQKSHAPKWMQNAGMEWIFRLASDPKRLWKRYFKHNPRFIYYLIKQLYFK
ncbi:MAG: WecB/TagA/CpsF family glycosyltransferase [Deltaproteobacteria bacterium]|uniref:WecB/TagA/CpsF family glycosyltransferase n=1 Tax=Desulfobacula sp. TaxID=2593537 RepID=UPI00199A947E|nr:WecB/TagA/CpsF family glycosyltransferase [Candidatus Desulfobacula maris]MBL6995172.1 WecB/TagA/CpsF family glycosyltransferase [Desulfobacula sp.]